MLWGQQSRLSNIWETSLKDSDMHWLPSTTQIVSSSTAMSNSHGRRCVPMLYHKKEEDLKGFDPCLSKDAWCVTNINEQMGVLIEERRGYARMPPMSLGLAGGGEGGLTSPHTPNSNHPKKRKIIIIKQRKFKMEKQRKRTWERRRGGKPKPQTS